MDLKRYVNRLRIWSGKTFGPGKRTAAVLDHIRKETAEIEADPGDLYEWADLIMIAMDGACRAGYSPQRIEEALMDKLAINEQREWPDWRAAEEGKAIEHIGEPEPEDPPAQNLGR